MARTQGAADVHVLFLAPAGVDEDRVRSDLWQAAAAIPGVHVARDDRGSEARRFGAATSGETLLYDGAGRLRFSGGVLDFASRLDRRLQPDASSRGMFWPQSVYGVLTASN